MPVAGTRERESEVIESMAGEAEGIHRTSRYVGSPESMERISGRLAGLVGEGDTLLLSGPIGAGKTVFARALIKTLLTEHGSDEDIPSPTYTLVQTYYAGCLEIWHADLYRIEGAEEVVELGLDEAFGSALCLVEWPERLGGLAPERAVLIQFGIPSGNEFGRTLRIETATRPMAEQIESKI